MSEIETNEAPDVVQTDATSEDNDEGGPSTQDATGVRSSIAPQTVSLHAEAKAESNRPEHSPSGVATAAAIGTGMEFEAAKQDLPPPRPDWTYGLISSCCNDPCFGCTACFCPCVAVARVHSLLEEGHENVSAPPGEHPATICCAYCCPADDIGGTRDRVRAKTNMTSGDRCRDVVCTSMCCWGCALAQDRRELQVYYGHAGPTAAPAAEAMRR